MCSFLCPAHVPVNHYAVGRNRPKDKPGDYAAISLLNAFHLPPVDRLCLSCSLHPLVGMAVRLKSV